MYSIVLRKEARPTTTRGHSCCDKSVTSQYVHAKLELESLSEPTLTSLVQIVYSADQDYVCKLLKDVEHKEESSSAGKLSERRRQLLAGMIARVLASIRTDTQPIVIYPVVRDLFPQDGKHAGKTKGVYIYCVDNKHIWFPVYDDLLKVYHTRQEKDAYNPRIISQRLSQTIANYILGCNNRKEKKTLRINKLMVGKVSYKGGGRVHHRGMLSRFSNSYHKYGYTHMVSLALFDPRRLEEKMSAIDVEKLALDVESNLHSYCRRKLTDYYDSELAGASTGNMVQKNHASKLYMVYLALSCSGRKVSSDTERLDKRIRSTAKGVSTLFIKRG